MMRRIPLALALLVLAVAGLVPAPAPAQTTTRTEDDLRRIVTIQVAKLRDRMADRRITLTLTDAALDWLAHEGYDPSFGARPLKRVIQREIADPSALLILGGQVTEGDTVTVDVVDGRLTLSS